MFTFFAIFFVLILVNVALLVSSLAYNNQKINKSEREKARQPLAKIYPFDLSSSKYEKAV